ncbi:MAG: helix-turn-helix domain-containing protein [Clostridia bacterium]|nr:helix-turn-helix domain-containing protein [Clostridia bacterium]
MNNVFAERLKMLRSEKGIGQIQLAKELDVGKSVISLWERGECEPTLSKLVAISKYFGVSIDYLAGLED